MKESMRQLLAGVLASVFFVGLYVGASLVWWAALLASVAVFAGTLLLVPKARDPNAVEVAPGVTKGELDAALRQCAEAGRELAELSKAPHLSREMASALSRLSRIVTDIGDDFAKDPEDIRHARGLTDHHLKAVIEVARAYVDLRKASLNDAGRRKLDEIRAVVTGYVDQFDAIYQACLANDFQRLEVATDALAQILKLEAPNRAG